MISPDDKLLAYLEKRARPGSPKFAPPGDPKRDYLGSGAHPDIVTRLWRGINDSLPADCRALVYGTPALIQPDTHTLLAVAIGTQYIVRVSATAIENGLPEKTLTVLKWFKSTTDLSDFGPDWVAGKSRPEEIQWCAENFLQDDVENG